MEKSSFISTSLVLAVLALVFGSSSLASAVQYDSRYDLFKDNRIDSQDLCVLTGNWLVDCSSHDCDGTDFDDSNKVDLADFALFANHWLTLELSAFDCDLVEDCHIDWKDLASLAEVWLADCSVDDCSGPDLNKNGKVDFLDYSLLAQHWSIDPNICLWEFIEHQWTNTMNLLTTDPFYSGTSYMFPRSTNYSTGKWVPTGAQWASGFIPGALWDLYQRTSEQQWRTWAETWTAALGPQQYRTNDHEAGFIIFRSYGRGYKITQNPAYKPVIIQACTSLATRYNSTVGCIRSWNNTPTSAFTVIVDGMMMLEMMFWGAKNGGSSSWYNMAVSHANKTMQNNVRENGSVWQAVDYSTINGSVVLKWNKQGYNNNTTWSRGQAWGIEGFTMAYRETLDPNYLNTAKKIANYFIDHLPEDYVPYWDFNAPEYPSAGQVRDSSAAAIAASGLLDLSTYVSDLTAKRKYYNAACNILNSLSSPAYLAHGTNSMGILLHGTGNGTRYPDLNAGEIDRSLMYGDHFFIEALLRRESIPPP